MDNTVMLSSTAERIYWMARYTERVENTSRLINVNFDLLLDIPHDEISDLVHLIEITSSLDKFSKKPTKENILKFLIYDQKNSGSIKYCLEMSKINSRYLRPLLPKTAWEQFNNMHISFLSSYEQTNNSSILHEVIRDSQRFFAIVSDAMARNDVYNFIKLGRFIERADMLSRLIEEQILRKEAYVSKHYENLQWMSILKSINGYESFKILNKEELRRINVLPFIIKDKNFPRSLIYCLDQTIRPLKELPSSKESLKVISKLKDATKNIKAISTDKQIKDFVDFFQKVLIDVHILVSKNYFIN